MTTDLLDLWDLIDDGSGNWTGDTDCLVTQATNLCNFSKRQNAHSSDGLDLYKFVQGSNFFGQSEISYNNAAKYIAVELAIRGIGIENIEVLKREGAIQIKISITNKKANYIDLKEY